MRTAFAVENRSCAQSPPLLPQASSGEDRLVHIWDLDLKRSPDTGPEAKRARVQLPPELLLTHAGHRAPVRPAPFHASVAPKQGLDLKPSPPISDLCPKLAAIFEAKTPPGSKAHPCNSRSQRQPQTLHVLRSGAACKAGASCDLRPRLDACFQVSFARTFGARPCRPARASSESCTVSCCAAPAVAPQTMLADRGLPEAAVGAECAPLSCCGGGGAGPGGGLPVEPARRVDADERFGREPDGGRRHAAAVARVRPAAPQRGGGPGGAGEAPVRPPPRPPPPPLPPAPAPAILGRRGLGAV